MNEIYPYIDPAFSKLKEVSDKQFWTPYFELYWSKIFLMLLTSLERLERLERLLVITKFSELYKRGGEACKQHRC